MKQEDYTIKQLLRMCWKSPAIGGSWKQKVRSKARAVWKNVEELVNKAVAYWEKAEEPSLDEFLEEVALVADVDQLDQSRARVTLMTLPQPQRDWSLKMST